MTNLDSARASILDEGVKSYVENREGRKSANVCVRKACGRAPKDDSDFCPKHHRAQLKYQRAYMKRKRARWEADGKCTRCGRDRKRGSKWCVTCLIQTGKVHHQDRKSDVENRQGRVAARLIPWENSPTNANRVRLRGGKRGAVPKAQIDEQDLEDAARGILHGGIGLKLLASQPTSEVSRAEKRRAELAALDMLASAARFVRDVLARHRYDVELDAKPVDGDGDDSSDIAPATYVARR